MFTFTTTFSIKWRAGVKNPGNLLTYYMNGPLARGRLVKWTKGFNCSGVEGEDVVQLLSEAIERRGDVKIEVCAILNDTTGNEVFIVWAWTGSKSMHRLFLI